MNERTKKKIGRRDFLVTSGAAVAAGVAGVTGVPSDAHAVTVKGVPEWQPMARNVPSYPKASGWQWFSPADGAVVEALVDRIIPSDDLSIGGKDAGCAAFIDLQLADAEYGTFSRLYMQGPFEKGTAEQGDQLPYNPRDRYRIGLSEMQKYCKTKFGKGFEALSSTQQDAVLSGMESGKIIFQQLSSKTFFAFLLGNTMEGFFADPVYGGNRNMVSWKLIGFPGARYDYRDYVERHNEKLVFEPLSIGGSPEWKKG